VSPAVQKVFALFLIKPSHYYYDDGYVIQWAKSSIPSNTLDHHRTARGRLLFISTTNLDA